MSIDAAVIDFSAGVLLRYFRGGASIAGDTPRVFHRRDFDLLKGHWSISGSVRALVEYVLCHSHEAQSLLDFQPRIDDTLARGRIDARKTWLYRLQSGLPSAIVAEEPVRSFNTGPNLVLAWVLRETATYTARLSSWQGPASPYVNIIERAQQMMRSIQRIEALREPLRAVSLGRRPGPGAVRAAARARRPIYRLAVEAYLLLQGLERGDPTAMNTVARSSLIAPLEDWRRFELAVALAAGEAIADASQTEMDLHLLGGNSSGPIITVGRFALYWQQRTTHYTPPPPEPSEVITGEILAAYGMSSGADRPDLVIVDRQRSAVIAVIEVKYLAGDSANNRFREAVEQVVRYARGYASSGETKPLIARSMVALSHGAPVLLDSEAGAPASVDFAGILHAGMVTWANRLTGKPT